MTAIAAIAYKGRVYMGGDGSVTDEHTQIVVSEPKVWRTSGMVFGCAGDLYALQHLKHVAEWPRYQGQKREQFLARKLCPALRKSLKELWEQSPAKSEADTPDVDLLVGIRGQIFGIDKWGAYYDAGKAWAIGSGGEAARAVLFDTVSESDPEQRLEQALEAAAAVCISVCEPFTILDQG